MAVKIYNKKGNTNYKEKRMIKEITEALAEKAKSDPGIYDQIVPANSYDELEKMRHSIVADDVSYQEQPATEEKTETVPVQNESNMSSNDTTIDPLNRQEPIIRDYVVDPHKTEASSAQSTFAEPVDFKDAFAIPEETEEENLTEPSNAGKERPAPRPQPQPRERVNPHFDDIDAKKQKRKVERFAKAITNLGCDLIEKGYVWYVTKDISESKIAEMEMKGQIDASLMLTLDENTQVTVKEFFKMQCDAAPEQAKIGKEQREDMTDALVEVFMEKGIAPSASQNAGLVAASILLPLGIQAYAVSHQNKSILSQLKQMARHERQDHVQDIHDDEPEPEQRSMNWKDLEGQELTDDLLEQHISDNEGE